VNWTKGELGLKLVQQEGGPYQEDIDPSCSKLGHQASLMCLEASSLGLAYVKVTLASCSLFGSKYHILDPFSLHFSRPLSSPFLI